MSLGSAYSTSKLEVTGRAPQRNNNHQHITLLQRETIRANRPQSALVTKVRNKAYNVNSSKSMKSLTMRDQLHHRRPQSALTISLPSNDYKNQRTITKHKQSRHAREKSEERRITALMQRAQAGTFTTAAYESQLLIRSFEEELDTMQKRLSRIFETHLVIAHGEDWCATKDAMKKLSLQLVEMVLLIRRMEEFRRTAEIDKNQSEDEMKKMQKKIQALEFDKWGDSEELVLSIENIEREILHISAEPITLGSIPRNEKHMLKYMSNHNNDNNDMISSGNTSSANRLQELIHLKFSRLEQLCFVLRKKLANFQKYEAQEEIEGEFGSALNLKHKYNILLEENNTLKRREKRFAQENILKRRNLSNTSTNVIQSLFLAAQNELSVSKMIEDIIYPIYNDDIFKDLIENCNNNDNKSILSASSMPVDELFYSTFNQNKNMNNNKKKNDNDKDNYIKSLEKELQQSQLREHDSHNRNVLLENRVNEQNSMIEKLEKGMMSPNADDEEYMYSQKYEAKERVFIDRECKLKDELNNIKLLLHVQSKELEKHKLYSLKSSLILYKLMKNNPKMVNKVINNANIIKTISNKANGNNITMMDNMINKRMEKIVSKTLQETAEMNINSDILMKYNNILAYIFGKGSHANKHNKLVISNNSLMNMFINATIIPNYISKTDFLTFINISTNKDNNQNNNQNNNDDDNEYNEEIYNNIIIRLSYYLSNMNNNNNNNNTCSTELQKIGDFLSLFELQLQYHDLIYEFKIHTELNSIMYIIQLHSLQFMTIYSFYVDCIPSSDSSSLSYVRNSRIQSGNYFMNDTSFEYFCKTTNITPLVWTQSRINELIKIEFNMNKPFTLSTFVHILIKLAHIIPDKMYNMNNNNNNMNSLSDKFIWLLSYLHIYETGCNEIRELLCLNEYQYKKRIDDPQQQNKQSIISIKDSIHIELNTQIICINFFKPLLKVDNILRLIFMYYSNNNMNNMNSNNPIPAISMQNMMQFSSDFEIIPLLFKDAISISLTANYVLKRNNQNNNNITYALFKEILIRLALLVPSRISVEINPIIKIHAFLSFIKVEKTDNDNHNNDDEENLIEIEEKWQNKLNMLNQHNNNNHIIIDIDSIYTKFTLFFHQAMKSYNIVTNNDDDIPCGVFINFLRDFHVIPQIISVKTLQQWLINDFNLTSNKLSAENIRNILIKLAIAITPKKGNIEDDDDDDDYDYESVKCNIDQSLILKLNKLLTHMTLTLSEINYKIPK